MRYRLKKLAWTGLWAGSMGFIVPAIMRRMDGNAEELAAGKTLSLAAICLTIWVFGIMFSRINRERLREERVTSFADDDTGKK